MAVNALLGRLPSNLARYISRMLRLLDVMTSQRCIAGMKARKTRKAVNLDADLNKAMEIKSVETEHSVSELINDAIRVSLLEDAEDLAACDARLKEPSLDFEDFLTGMRRRDQLDGGHK